MKRTSNEGHGEVRSPCVKKCSLDRNKICPECYRSIDEIVSWRDADNSMKRTILEAAKLRRLKAVARGRQPGNGSGTGL